MIYKLRHTFSFKNEMIEYCEMMLMTLPDFPITGTLWIPSDNFLQTSNNDVPSCTGLNLFLLAKSVGF